MKLSNKFVGWTLAGTIFVAATSGFGSGILVFLAGLSLIVFGGVASYRLIKDGK